MQVSLASSNLNKSYTSGCLFNSLEMGNFETALKSLSGHITVATSFNALQQNKTRRDNSYELGVARGTKVDTVVKREVYHTFKKLFSRNQIQDFE